MLAFLADENFHGILVRGLLHSQPDLDVVRIQDVGLMGVSDDVLLEWAAQHHRVLLTHDVTTMGAYAYDRIERGLPMPGILEVKDSAPFKQAIEEIVMVAVCSFTGEMENCIRYIPL